LKISPHYPQQTFVGYAARKTGHQNVVVYSVKEFLKVHIDHKLFSFGIFALGSRRRGRFDRGEIRSCMAKKLARIQARELAISPAGQCGQPPLESQVPEFHRWVSVCLPPSPVMVDSCRPAAIESNALCAP
jgi:hypothetical protein